MTVIATTTDQVIEAYGSRARELANMLGGIGWAEDPDRALIELWADTVSGTILDVGAGTGRWSGHLAALDSSEERWAGILAWYSLIHLGPGELPEALSNLRGVLEDRGSILISFFSGPPTRGLRTSRDQGVPVARRDF